MATKPRKPRNVIGGTIDKQLKEAFGALPKKNEMTTVPLVEGGNVQEVILDVKEGDVTITVTQETTPVIDATPAAEDKAAAAAAPVVTKADIGLNIAEPVVQGIDVSITATEAAVTPPSAPVTDGQPRVSRGHRGFGEYCRFLESLTAETIASSAQQLRDEEIKKAQKAALQKAFDEAKEALEKAA